MDLGTAARQLAEQYGRPPPAPDSGGGFFGGLSNALASIDPSASISKAVTDVLQSDVGKAAAIAALAYVNPFAAAPAATGAAEAQAAIDAAAAAPAAIPAAAPAAIPAAAAVPTTIASMLPGAAEAQAAIDASAPAVASPLAVTPVPPITPVPPVGGDLMSTPEPGASGAPWTPSPDAGTVAYPAVAGATGASTLADMLPYMTAGNVASSLIGANAAQNAANAQSAAANAGITAQQQMFNIINAQQAPQRAAGYQALSDIGRLGSGTYQTFGPTGAVTGTGQGTGYWTQQYTPEEFAKGIDPGYLFRLQQGQMANQRLANVGGGALSGNTLRGLQDYTQGQASQEFQNAFNRFQTGRTNIYNTLAGIAGLGQTGQNQVNTAAQNAINAQTQLGVGSAAAQAAGQVGTANAVNQGINQIAQQYMLANLLNQNQSVG